MFNLNLYISEMNRLVDNSINEVLRGNANFQFYTIYIWTEADNCESGIDIDDFANCQKEVERLNEATKKRQTEYANRFGDTLDLPLRTRNYNGMGAIAFCPPILKFCDSLHNTTPSLRKQRTSKKN